MKVANWGLYPTVDAEVRGFSSAGDARETLQAQPHLIPRGLGRCYGDSALSEFILSSDKFGRFLSLDAENGILHGQSGLSFADILDVIVPQGWFLPVTPGTKFITLGGAIAADIHGKNHHSEGSFTRYVHSLRLLTASGEVLTCSREQHPDVFAATCGGMGLTGVILDAEFSLKKIETAYIREESIKTKNLEELFPLFSESAGYTYSVAWIDCLAKGKHLGKGILLNGEHALVSDLQKPKHKAAPLVLPRKRKINIPLHFPSFTINKLTVKAFNKLWYAKAPRGRHTHIVDYDTYFYPLDGIHHWNRVYGRRGFAQYQFVIPPDRAFDGLTNILERISSRGFPSFLTVLKTMGPPEGMISFPLEGYTLALDFPRTPSLFPFLDELDKIVLEHGGRIYLTKDSRMKPAMMAASYPRLEEFKRIREQLDPNHKLESLQSRRLEL